MVRGTPIRFALNHMVAPQLSLGAFFALARAVGLSDVEIRNDIAGEAILDGTPAATVRRMAEDAGLTILTINALQKFNHWSAQRAAEAEGVALYINARADVYLKALAEGHAAFVETVRRAELYRDAGASGIFVPGPKDDDLIDRLADAIRLPLNILLLPGLSPAERLRALGVRRLSAGSAPFRAAYATLAGAVARYLETGEIDAFAAGAAGRENLNRRFGG